MHDRANGHLVGGRPLKSRPALPGLALVLTALLPAPAAAAVPADAQTRKAIIGEPDQVLVQPSVIELSGPHGMRQILVTGSYRDGSVRDLTPFCEIRPADDVCGVAPGGFVQGKRDGDSFLVIAAGARSVRVPVTVRDSGKPRPVSFRRDVIAVLNVGGCNAGACHGTPSGKGGFRLSLRGYDPAADYLQLTRDVLGRRTARLDAEASLLLHKALGRVPHEGGQRFGPDSIPARTLRAWLAEGLRDDPADLPAVTRIEVLPAGRVLVAPARWQQLAVVAHFADGSRRDVTRLTVFGSSDPAVAEADPNGLVEFHRPGEAAILCRYLERMQAVRLTYLQPRQDFAWPNPPQNNYVDTHVFAKLKMLNVLPSDLCTDHEFLRRVYLDLCGMIPTPQEARAFLADRSPDKRDRLIDRLLERPEFVDYWTFKWLDLLRSKRTNLQIKGVHVYQRWMRDHVAANTPWDRVVRELLTASGSTFANPPANYYRGTYNNKAGAAVRDPESLAETTAQLFFGVRMQCAKCHNHPFERWTQDDYYRLAAFFARVRAKPDPVQPGGPPLNYPWQLREDAAVIYAAREGEVVQPRTIKQMAPGVMGMAAPAIPPGKDRREVLADLVAAADNPFFAKATVNRLWFGLLGRGIVDPPDDFRDSNPPANDELLDALARDFVAHRFDTRHVLRTIVRSRTYQLSAHTNPTNREDDRYFSHALVGRKRLSAEVLLDALCAATEVPEKFTGVPPGTRAVQLPDGEVVYTGGQYASWDRHPFMKTFGQPAREVACECERESDLNLARALELKNGPLLYKKIRAPDNRLGRLLARKLPDAAVLDELFLATLSRPPQPEEARAALDLVAKAADRRAGWEGVLWALLNTNEFLLRH
jgi:hypothetical protein